ncbi:MAG: hypothetical protein J6Y71_02610 [Ruminococcus sp.]|nr:hypothetical protein [Ruminococcus sp.]
MKLRMISQFDHFPTHTTKDKSAPRMYVDGKIWEAMDDTEVLTDMLLLIEPRSIQPENYLLAMDHYNRFRYIFTHDSQLLRFAPNALPIFYWRDYELKDEFKRKDISMICGTKRMCPIHRERMKIADVIEDQVDILGDYKGERCTIDEAYSEYKFAVVIENYLDDWWFTEKILNAFSHKTVPIYYGARYIGAFFDEKGIIRVRKLWDIPKIIDILYESGLEKEYYSRSNAIMNNYQAVQKYRDFEDLFFKKYSDLLERMMEDLK